MRSNPWPRRTAIAAGILLALIAALWLAAAHATWARPLVKRYVAEHAHRAIDFERLELGFEAGFEPFLSLHGVTIENASWADSTRPLVSAGELKFVYSWKSLHDEKIIFSRVVLVDAQLDLERKADGLRNWRLGHPDDRGPGRVRVLSVDAERSELRFLYEGIGLDVAMRMAPLSASATTSASALDPPARALPADLPLIRTFAFEGTRKGHPFRGEAAVSRLLTFADTGKPFALRGRVTAGGSSLDVDGTAADVQTMSTLDVALRLASTKLSDLEAVSPVDLPDVPTKLALSAQLGKKGDTWRVTGLQATLAGSDLHGDLTLVDRRPRREPGAAPALSAPASATNASSAARRPLLRATLTSDTFRSADITALFKSNGPKKAFDPQRLFALDANLDLHVAHLVLPPAGATPLAVSRLVAQLSLEDGRLGLAPFAMTVGGGRVSGAAHADGAVSPMAVALQLDVTGVRAEQFGKTLAGGIDGRLAVESQGDTLEALLAGASGHANVSLAKATIPKKLDARLGLDGIAMLGTLFNDSTDRVPVQCALVVADLHAGRAVARRMVFETEHVALDGSGSADLRAESVDLLLTPTLKQRALIALERSFHVSGPIAKPAVTLVDRVPPKAGEAGCGAAANPLTPVVARADTPRDTAARLIARQAAPPGGSPIRQQP